MTDKVQLRRVARNKRLQESIVGSADDPNRVAARALSLKLIQELLASRPDFNSLDFIIYSQLVRSINSVGANLSEGSARGGGQDWIRFAVISRASAEESIFHAECLSLPNLVEYIELKRLTDLTLERLLHGLEVSDY